jgi:hypothetical protein
MKASELIEKLEGAIEEVGDGNVYFDTEAACFNYHLVEIEALTYHKEICGNNITLFCDTELYDHTIIR